MTTQLSIVLGYIIEDINLLLAQAFEVLHEPRLQG